MIKNIFGRNSVTTAFTELEDPIRAEIFSIARLEEHAQSLARAQEVTDTPRQGQNLAHRISENRRVLTMSYQIILQAVEERRAITPAGEWLIDNFHIVRSQLKDIHDHLPPEYYKLLPKIESGPLAGYPRVYGIAWAFVAHTDSKLEPILLKTFLSAYQKVQPLTIGELWAIPITLRVVLIENLRRLAARIVASQKDRLEADLIADSLLGVGESTQRTSEQVIDSLENYKITRSFAVQLLQRLRFQEDRVGPLLQYIERRLGQENTLIEEWVSTEHVSQSSANITVRNIITSARLISAFDWPKFIEEVSLVDKLLRENSDFGLMDFTTRDRYRHRIEQLSRYSGQSEIKIAEALVQTIGVQNANKKEPGYFLIGKGRFDFEKSIGFKVRFRIQVLRWYKRNGAVLHLGSIFFLTLSIFSILMTFTFQQFQTSIPFAIVSFLVLLTASELAISLINRWTVAIVGPRHLPRLDFEKGLRKDLKTFIVVPTMLTDASKVRHQLEQIEVHYLANQDENIYLALLTDFADSKTEKTERDAHLLETAQSELSKLNARYPVERDGIERFSIFHRRRLYNSQEKCWMGWERKRGKLHEFNLLLLGSNDTSYEPFYSQRIQVPKDIRYVITLDADTKLPRGSVSQLVGTMAHPLNAPIFDESKSRIVTGYGILQPRITPSLPSEHESTVFRKLSTVRSGIDPYASAVSDVYQDLFEEGSFTGKGIYDLQAFETALSGKIPENSVLSHDLLEGNFARCGYLSDVDFFEDFPSHTGVASLRNHRWIRGDWQLLPWIFGLRKGSISVINRWKMIDNLRRSIISPAVFALFFLAPIFYGFQSWPLVAFIFLNFLAPALITLWADLWSQKKNRSSWQNLVDAFEEFQNGWDRALMTSILLPQNAWISLDAIIRVLYRMTISRLKLLEWTTAAQVKASANHSIGSFLQSMKGAMFLNGLGALGLLYADVDVFIYALPFIVIWFCCPVLAHYFSRPPQERITHPIKSEDTLLFQTTARRIWRFFVTFVNETENFLPPDNFQEDPIPIVAHRSSPTNFGLYLLSIFAARDFGWIAVTEVVSRLELTLGSLMRLEKFEGHFFNWYDTTDLRPLEPRYISSVDNGNLTGHLVAVFQGCEEILNSPLATSNFQEGVFITLKLLEQEIDHYKTRYLEVNNNFVKVLNAQADLAARLMIPIRDIKNQAQYFMYLKSQSALLVKYAKVFAGDPVSPERSEILAWSMALQSDIQSFAKDFATLTSWSDFAEHELIPQSSSDTIMKWDSIRARLRLLVPLKDLNTFSHRLLSDVVEFKKSERQARREIPDFIDTLLDNLVLAIEHSNVLTHKLRKIQKDCRTLINEMDFNLLYDSNRKLFSIGMRVQEKTLDPSYYDLLASEARLTSFIAIAKGDVPVAHWFHLGRSLVNAGQGAALVSWSGSMFEYLMPCIVMHTPEASLLEETCRNAVLRHIEYGTQKNIPWGISESAFHKRDLELTYQYSNFGVPDLGLKRGLSADLVVAPYSTILAAIFEPAYSAENLRRLQKQGAEGPYGFYEAIDYTKSRLPSGRQNIVVKTYMAHHQGMSLVALANIFKDSAMQKRFHADPSVQATELLLQERTPHSIGTLPPHEENIQISLIKEPIEHVSRRYHAVNRPVPTTQILSNGNYSVMLTSAGSGFSRIRDLAVTRWREDITRDHYGSFIYIKDCETQEVWSAGHQPICVDADQYEVSFAEDRVHIKRLDHDILCDLEVFISPEENAEIRRLRLTNNSAKTREIEITSYLEVVLNAQGADVAHPAFSNLFIETEYRADASALIASRRPRSNQDKRLWMMHHMQSDRYAVGPTQWETDRGLFIGRGKTLSNPQAMFDRERLFGTTGPVLDPVLSLRTRIQLPPGATSNLTFTTGVAENRDSIDFMIEKFSDPSSFERASDLAWTQAQVKLHFLGIEPDEAHLFQRLITRLLYSDPSLRSASEILKRNVRDLTTLWSHGISGDHPIILVRIDDIEDRNLIRQLLRAQSYFAVKGFAFDLIVLNEKSTSYSQELQLALEQMAQGAFTRAELNRHYGKVFVLRSELLPETEQILLASEARIILSTRHGSLSDQVRRTFMVPLTAPKLSHRQSSNRDQLLIPDLEFFNGYGGFSNNGEEYTIVLKDKLSTPAPWINVIANSDFGFQVSESGSGYTWSINSRENQLTPWSNDPVCDPSGEALFIRDLDSDDLWSPTASPIRIPEATYLSHHGQGYSRFETSVFGIQTELKQFVATDMPVKISQLTLENKTQSPRRLSITSYTEWVLGFSRATMAPTTVTEFDEESRALFAWNCRNIEHGKRVAFSAVVGKQTTFTCDRTEFIGRNSNLSQPAGLIRNESLKRRDGGGFDPCAAIQTEIEIKPGEKVEVAFMLGQASNRAVAKDIIVRVRGSDLNQTLKNVQQMWKDLLTKIQVETPDRRFDIVINRWYLYQTIVCRLWARAAFYQAGGAFGFRDQLQDVMAVILTSPKMAREQILRAASRQFIEGDVQHWWHPPMGRGVRTRFSDDLLWLPYVVSNYIKVTKDNSILEEVVGFLEGPELLPEQEDSYYTPDLSIQKGSVYEHCVRAINHSLKTGVHGLPLIGCGDWNDGMNHVGIGGKGESVWLAWFLFTNLRSFAEVAKQRGETERAHTFNEHAVALIRAVEKTAWDGAWYRRAFFDDGTPLGSNENTECKIDSLAQTWAVISGAADPERAKIALNSVFENLVKSSENLILLFTPPFNKTKLNPGYIKGYLPGVRENGGQYTHAASWVVIAAAMIQDSKRAYEVFAAINPLNHSQTTADVNNYKIEPYVLAGDVYSEEPHTGRGGWSWYTGAAGWMYRAGVESILGLEVSGNELNIKPCVPNEWDDFTIRYRFGNSDYKISIEMVDLGNAQSGKVILIDDGQSHEIQMKISRPNQKI